MLSLSLFAFKNSFRKKGASILAILGVGIGISIMIFILSVTQGVNKMFDKYFNAVAGRLVVSATASPLGLSATGKSSFLPREYVKEIEKMEYVKVASPRLISLIPRESLNIADPFGIIASLDPQKDKLMEGPTVSLVEGRSFRKKGEVIVGVMLVQSAKLAKNEIKIGDEIKVPLPSKKKGAPPKIYKLKVVGIFETGNILEDWYIFSSEETLKEIANIPKDKVNLIIVEAERADKVEKLAEMIKKKFSERKVPVNVTISKEVISNFQQTINTFSQFRVAVSVVIGIVGGISILIVMLISVLERKVEFGILKAIGWSKKDIVTLVFEESLILSLLGAGLGIVLGYIFTLVAGYYIDILSEIVKINLKVISFIFLFGVFIGVLGGVYPSWRAAKVSPMESLRGL